MTCSNCSPDVPQNPCSSQSITICQPIPFPVEPETVQKTDCYADNCSPPLTLQEFASLVLAELCKLNISGVSDCHVPVGDNGKFTYKTVLDIIAQCAPHRPGEVLTSDGSNVMFAPSLSCTTFKNKFSTCLSSSPNAPVKVLGSGVDGLAFYEPASINCSSFVSFLTTCVNESSDPAIEVLAYQNGVPVKAPLPVPPALGCAEFRNLFGCVAPSTTPTSRAITIVNGTPVLAPIASINCTTFSTLLMDCPNVSSTPASTVLGLLNGEPTYQPLPTATTPPEITDKCIQPAQIRGKDANGDEAFFQLPEKYNLLVGFTGTTSQQMQGFNVLNNLLFPSLIQEAGLCGVSSRYNPATGVFTVDKSAVYSISVNFYIRTRVTTSGAFTGTPQYSSYGALVVVIPANPPVIQGITPIAGASSFRFNESQSIADNQTNNKVFTYHTTMALPAGTQVWVRYVLVNQPTGALTITSADLFATGINSGQDSFFRVIEQV